MPGRVPDERLDAATLPHERLDAATLPLERLDAALVRRGLVRSRGLAAEAISAGRVHVDGRPAGKASQRVPQDSELTVEGDDPTDRWVSRSAGKLDAALTGFEIDPAGVLALDVGASTGGFTQVLLERGAREVIALDVGHGQLAPAIRDDPRVRVVEGVNARELTPELLAGVSGTAERPSIVVADLSFIPLGLVLPALAAVAAAGARFVLLVKPQFEVGRVREGIVRDRTTRHAAVRGVLEAAAKAGLRATGVMSSPVVGGSGNQEYLVALSADVGGDPTEWSGAIDALP
ncbi:MAG: TlyA family RNA methyltransferase [Microbacteriaceae bacterium]|nr:TlyA family RNA methyltransferase [Microbacteriaceae bacterium]